MYNAPQHMNKNRNKVEIQKICPLIPKNELIFTDKNAVLGISINSPSTVGNKISAIFSFLSKRGLKKINLLIGDSLYKYTAMIKHQCSEQEGKNIAIESSNDLIQYYTKHMNDWENHYKLSFFPSSEIAKDKDFPTLYEKLWKLFEININFRQSVLNFSQYYFDRAFPSSLESIEREKFKIYACKYLLEELVIFAILNQRGFNILIYPGVIQTIYDIITMDHPDLSRLFNGYMFVSLRICRS